MRILKAIFARDYVRYEGVRPVQIFLMRLGYVLVPLFVGPRTWLPLLEHRAPADPLASVAVAMWAGSSALSVFGLINPLRWLPLFLFEIAYKALWLGFVAYPLWTANRLIGTPAEPLAYSFIPVVIPIVAMPWGYVLGTFVLPSGRRFREATTSAEPRAL